jgi:hypothetical protein
VSEITRWNDVVTHRILTDTKNVKSRDPHHLYADNLGLVNSAKKLFRAEEEDKYH